MACFDDALSRAVSDATLHRLIESFIANGVVLRPRHIKIIACRILHRNMTDNALRVMIQLHGQVTERHRQTQLSKQGAVDNVTLIDSTELSQFAKALRREVLNNEDWKEKSRTIQISGDSSGSTYSIPRAPTDVVNFVDECGVMLQNIVRWEPSCDLAREELPRGMLKPVPVSSKIKRWFRNHHFFSIFHSCS
jgi:hypothetical protein